MIGLVGLLVLPVGTVLLLTADAAPYWGQPDERAVITAAAPAGTIDDGRETCDASRFTVQDPAGRTGSFRDCRDDRAVGDQVTVRWRSSGSARVQVDVQSPGEVLGIGALVAGGCAVVGSGAVWAERRRRARLAAPTFRTRR